MTSSPATPHPGISQREFIILIALMMTVGALGTDTMLPALPAIGKALHVADVNRTQLVISAYSLGFGITQLIWGPLADRYGRKPVLFAGLFGYAVMAFLVTLTTSLTMLITFRAIQGMMVSSTRVIVASVVRDCYSGRHMARVMSLANMIFFAAPILAPSVGSAVLAIGPWEWIFWFLAVIGTTVMFWTSLRLPETLHEEDRRPIELGPLTAAWKATVADRFSLGYTLAGTCMFGTVLGYINSVEQIIDTVFRAPHIFPFAFAGVSAGMALMTFGNARLVVRYGTRRLSHAALIALILISAVHLAVIVAGHETLTSYLVLQTLQMATLGMVGSNFGAMAMEHVGHFAGTAASVQGAITGVGAAVLGIIIGQSFNGTTFPLTLGVLLLAMLALGIVFVTEGGRLFTARHSASDPARPNE